ncbi:uncharacterized protein LOC122030886 [Zingiber officinale]|uniref:uncharacterized protein LOC122030886 n=1 Tax=Zingiber officinale TaxID=94328 RepID=UPI001C4D2BC8|nr:uncharacterized protein LOC122030886 [Zingiber officinale]
MTTLLYGFTGNEVLPVGQTRLAISLGEEPLRRTRASNFIVVDAPSAFNVILGRPALNEFWVVVSTFCQKIKFPVEDKVSEVRGEQLAAQRCYVEMVRAESRSARKTPQLEGYHQVPLARDDQEKVSFITADGTYCYNVMPFELKNAGATYQRLMNKVFRKQIKAELGDIEETFYTLRMYGVKLNPHKCLFGAKSDHFLSYIVTERGIEANPSKVRALRDMPPPRNLKEDAESRYTGLEKLAFALVLTARRLRPYFLANTIVVMTNSPLGRVLLNLEASGRLIKWTTELSEFDIQYQPRTTIKAQSLADFVSEVQNPEPEATWRVYLDGLATRQGSGIDLLMISPQEEWMHLSVRLDYRATNNEAEYEAFIAGLQAAWHVGASKVLIYSDSQLDAQQLLGTFEINNTRLKLYTKAFDKLKTNFGEVVIQKIPRTENQAADGLAKLASSITPIGTQQPIEQVSLVAHIDRMEGLAFPSDWRTAIAEFLQLGAAPSDRAEAQLLRRRAGRFTLIGDQLYKKAFSRPLLKCVNSESNEQTEVTNREILRILRVRLDHVGSSWVDELPGVLWVIRTTPKEEIGVTPFHLVYGGEAVVPVEVGIEYDRVQRYNGDNVDRRQLELDLIDETRAKAAAQLMAYRQRMKQHYNRLVIPNAFQVDDLVWKKVKSVGDVSKLEAPWAGPFRVIEKLRSGAYYLEDEDRRQLERPWNTIHLQPYRSG